MIRVQRAVFALLFCVLLIGGSYLSCAAYRECREAGGGKMLCLRLVTR